ncbi:MULTISPECIES: phosphate regulon sensor histidine kinase PhoR [Xanthomonas]|uniref:Phosphate regulon sensor protein PhoR n=1 Tax=Xanthomonas rydalmerensis TaxID=3046274 RepID=A0ABZ0JJH4_9XANT|nr:MULTISPECIES: phosphate regulon sensor histidine kinase PhoR [unclassified Xanthomonas]MBB5876787.1 two-component system phosphate regulon sensor histidine kinase PhoR [Xanthomonas sp. 3498]MBB5941317.1 two-component system phosphate regulon sensor histidine kinase PhoR [Xanthomonas sp. 3307]MXV06602.1 phosphate regulon sensor histidine kinase PhoR [Xanthomonas sp. LMG 9002]WOS39957.1 phosphate regulon sensor histidine kinase PhoR [Xanthomonas sp. DM-2023]WOS44141.1 phosphate regulon sensor
MPRHIRSAWLKTLGTLAGMLLLALLVGWIGGHVWMALTLMSLGVMGWHYWRLRRVLRRLTARQRWEPPAGTGVWNELDRLLYRSQAEMRVRKRRLLDMLRAYRAAAAALPDAVVVVDRNSQRIQWFNEAAGTLLGLRHPGDLGAPVVERLQPMPLAHWLSGGRNAEPMLDMPSPVDDRLRLNLRLIPYSDDHWLLVARDVSKLLQLEQVRRDFVANVSHELRTPLTVVHGYLDMLDPEDFPDSGPMIAEMRKQSQRMTQLVEDLLTLSRLESQEHANEESIAMAPMLATLRREAEAHSQGRHRIEVHDEADCDLVGSNKELHSAFSNLVTNAVRYTAAGGTIRIRFAREGDGAVLSVRDSGYGIPAHHLPRITERFYRVSSSRSRESGGTGLGLSIVKHVLGLHQARLEIESEVGKGSTFSCHFGAGRVHPRHDHATLTSV